MARAAGWVSRFKNSFFNEKKIFSQTLSGLNGQREKLDLFSR
jgi:hypothetical protein